jgi:transcriptional regulator with XRE-family HTH domain
MGRPLLYPDWQTRADRGGPKYRDVTFCEWSGVIGDRMRRLRRIRDLTLEDMTLRVRRPDSPRLYTHSYFSRIERGYASAPMYVYLAIAHALEVHPGRLMGADDAERDASADEMTLVEYVRLAGIAPSVAIHVLATHAAEAERSTRDEAGEALRPPPEVEWPGPGRPPPPERARPAGERFR